jgi:hypothetical protein
VWLCGFHPFFWCTRRDGAGDAAGAGDAPTPRAADAGSDEWIMDGGLRLSPDARLRLSPCFFSAAAQDVREEADDFGRCRKHKRRAPLHDREKWLYRVPSQRGLVMYPLGNPNGGGGTPGRSASHTPPPSVAPAPAATSGLAAPSP